jgi:hypothetical protein
VAHSNHDTRKWITFAAVILGVSFSSHAYASSKDPVSSLEKEICKIIGKRNSHKISKKITKKRAARVVAAFLSDSLRRKLEKLNPQLTSAQIEAKIETCTSPFIFMRSFVSSYYDLIENGIPGHARRFAALKKFQGWIGGDVHVENFGPLLNDKGKATLTMNDLDDFSPGPVYLDFLRLISSAKIYDSKTNVKALKKAYQKGLDGKNWTLSDVTLNLLKKSEKKGLTVNSDLPSDAVQFTSEEKEKVQKWVQDQLGSEFTFKDGYKRDRDHGGSGGLQRVELLLVPKDRAHAPADVIPVELKELTTPATFPIQTGPMPTAEERIRKGLEVTLGSDASPIYRVVEWDGKKMEMRPRWRGNLTVDLTDLSSSQMAQVVADEAYVWGLKNRRLADDPAGYSRAFSQYSAQDWDQESDRVVEGFKEMYQTL